MLCVYANRKIAVVLTNFSATFPFVTCVKESENQPNGFVESHKAVKLGLHVLTRGSIVANPIIYRLVPSPSRFETRRWTIHTLVQSSERRYPIIHCCP